MGYGWGLGVYYSEAPLTKSMAQLTCVHTLMCFGYILLFCFRIAGILERFVL